MIDENLSITFSAGDDTLTLTRKNENANPRMHTFFVEFDPDCVLILTSDEMEELVLAVNLFADKYLTTLKSGDKE
jgi:hypothetical protein